LCDHITSAPSVDRRGKPHLQTRKMNQVVTANLSMMGESASGFRDVAGDEVNPRHLLLVHDQKQSLRISAASKITTLASLQGDVC